jgi:hypothetical protein
MMLELIEAIGAISIVALSTISFRRYKKDKADELAQLIAMGDGFGIEYVPGEAIDGACGYRDKVIDERNRRARAAARMR